MPVLDGNAGEKNGKETARQKKTAGKKKIGKQRVRAALLLPLIYSIGKTLLEKGGREK